MSNSTIVVNSNLVVSVSNRSLTRVEFKKAYSTYRKEIKTYGVDFRAFWDKNPLLYKMTDGLKNSIYPVDTVSYAVWKYKRELAKEVSKTGYPVEIVLAIRKSSSLELKAVRTGELYMNEGSVFHAKKARLKEIYKQACKMHWHAESRLNVLWHAWHADEICVA